MFSRLRYLPQALFHSLSYIYLSTSCIPLSIALSLITLIYGAIFSENNLLAKKSDQPDEYGHITQPTRENPYLYIPFNGSFLEKIYR